MRLFDAWAQWIGGLLQPLGTCGNAGVLVGMIAGGVIALMDFIEGPLAWTTEEAVFLWLILALFGWVALIFVFVVLVRWTLGSIVVPTLVNALLVTGLTVLVTHLTGLHAWAFLIGIAIGAIVGGLLCFIYGLIARGANDGVH